MRDELSSEQEQVEPSMEFLSVAGQDSAEIMVRRSRFIASVAPAFDEEEAERFIDSIRLSYPGATHNVYAYTVGTGSPLDRLSDDGEPRGTAGYPILEIIYKRELKNVVCVVTRYFGGIKLGAGGLLRAYGRAAAEGLDKAGTARYAYYNLIAADLEYDQLGRVQRELESAGCMLADVSYGATVTLEAYVRSDLIPMICGKVKDLTRGNVVPVVREGRYFPAIS